MKYVTSIWTLVALATLWIGACGGKQSKVEDQYLPPDEPQHEKEIGAAPSCVDEDDEPIQCERDDECCAGFVCGIDPELSARIKHCIYAGK